jgi:hypothetical protein
MRARLPSVTNFRPLHTALFRARAGFFNDKSMRRGIAVQLGGGGRLWGHLLWYDRAAGKFKLAL